MVFSKIYYNAFAGSRVKAEQSSFLSVNPTKMAGTALFVGTCAERAALGGQVASKLALQHFLNGAHDSLDEPSTNKSISDSSLAALEAAFRTANAAVYEFGHKLSAGGRMAASLISVFVRGDFIATGRVGKGVAYLARNGEVFPFFSKRLPDQEVITVGSNSIVSVELASVPAQAGDIVLVFSDPIPVEEESELGYMVSLLLPKFDQLDEDGNLNARGKGSGKLDGKACERLTQQLFGEKGPAFASIIALGPEVTFLEPQLSVA